MDVLFIYAGKHEAHKPFVEAIGADVYPAYRSNVNGFRRFVEAFRMVKEYPDCDIYLLEGGMPKHSFKEGMRKTVEWYMQNEWWWKPLADEKILHPKPWKLEW